MSCVKTSLPAYILLTVLRVGEGTDRAGAVGKVQVENTFARQKHQYFQFVIKIPDSNVGTLVIQRDIFSAMYARIACENHAVNAAQSITGIRGLPRRLVASSRRFTVASCKGGKDTSERSSGLRVMRNQK